ncbi:hypothetical protein PIB30_013224 [Stylosanthes scabra]|uniref:Secreted protein n=1 Tax=Stylosanthes scabra TaxID=79078 RepID=A0ABU6Q742_9FABA|nr:hypothetical protein [Stylosanthes scabra]
MFAVFFCCFVSDHNRRFPSTGTRVTHPFILVRVGGFVLELLRKFLITLFSLFQQGLLPGCHGFCPYHLLSGGLSIPSLSLEELSQGSFHLLNILVQGDYSLLRGKLGGAFVDNVVVELSVHHLWFGGSASVSQLDSKV